MVDYKYSLYRLPEDCDEYRKVLSEVSYFINFLKSQMLGFQLIGSEVSEIYVKLLILA